MKIKVFTLRMKAETGVFDDKELSDFQLGKDVIELSEHFLVHEKSPTLVLVLRYRENPEGAHPSAEAARKDWREELDAGAKRIYDELRLWRGRKAKQEGMPPYLILNNRELAELAVRKPDSAARLREIAGIGEAKTARWGEEILTLLAQLCAAAGQKPAVAPPAVTPPPPGGGYALSHGRRRIASIRPLGENPPGYSLTH